MGDLAVRVEAPPLSQERGDLRLLHVLLVAVLVGPAEEALAQADDDPVKPRPVELLGQDAADQVVHLDVELEAEAVAHLEGLAHKPLVDGRRRD